MYYKERHPLELVEVVADATIGEVRKDSSLQILPRNLT
jgi:hypothetical protein